jgi:DNA invertase Pin-like site-specific DNA recombinase
MNFVREKDVVVVCKLDRLARSTLDLYQIADQLKRKGGALEVLDQQMDTETLTGKVLFGMLSIMAEFETTLRKERQREGILAAHAGQGRALWPGQAADAGGGG